MLVPGGLVANRMLEEDPPRYTRASDPCEPRMMGENAASKIAKPSGILILNYVHLKTPTLQHSCTVKASSLADPLAL